MNSKQKLTFGLLIFGFIFSSIIRIRFNISGGFNFHDIWLSSPLPLFDFSAHSTNEQALTSTIIGYLLFALFGFFLITDYYSSNLSRIILTPFLLLTIIASMFEITSLIQDFNSNFVGNYVQIGPTLFIFGLFIYIIDFRKKN
jgi:hypothetical protein